MPEGFEILHDVFASHARHHAIHQLGILGGLEQTVSFKPATGVPVKTPPNGIQTLSISLVTTSSLLIPSVVMDKMRAHRWADCFVPSSCIL